MRSNASIIALEDVETEIRHMFLTTLKGTYWHYFEESQCSPETIVLLNESVDRALDHDDQPIKDWEFIISYIISDFTAKILRSVKNVPVLGYFSKSKLFQQFSFIYDIIVNFLDGHDHAFALMKENYGDERILAKIMMESKKQTDAAEKYMNDKIETPFPEICKAI